MKVTEILILGTHPEIVKTVLRLVNNNPEWAGTSASSVQEAEEICRKKHFQLVLVGGGISEEDEQELHGKLKMIHKDLTIVRHYGGGSGLLTAEIYNALNG